MNKLRKIFLVLTMLVASSMIFGQDVQYKQTVLKLSGLTWGGWIATVKLTLSGLEGIKKTYVSLEQGIVVFNPKIASADRIAQAINEKTSFEAQVASVGEEDPQAFPKSCGFLGLFCD